MAHVPSNDEGEIRLSTLPIGPEGWDDLPVRQFGQWALVWRRFRRHRMAVVGVSFILFMVALALLGPLVSPGLVPYDINGNPPLWASQQANIAPQLWPPHWRFLMGTDQAANPVITYVLQGGQPLLLIGIAGALIASIVGTSVGGVAGYLGGAVDVLLMRVVDAFLAIPLLLLLVLVSQQLGFADRTPTIYAAMFGLLGWPGVARLVRGYILSLREREFADAARALGASPIGIIFRHLLPNALDVLVVSLTLNVAIFIVIEVTLDYLNAGTNALTWGTPLPGAFAAVMIDNWWLGVFPTLPILFTALGFNLLGDGLRDALDVTSPTGLVVGSAPLEQRPPGPVRRGATSFAGGLRLVRERSVAAIGQQLRSTSAQRLAGRFTITRSRVRYRLPPWPIRFGVPGAVGVGLGIVMLYGHSAMVYSPHYAAPVTYTSTYDTTPYGAIRAPDGGWDVLAVDPRIRVAYSHIDAAGQVTAVHELAHGTSNSDPSLARHAGTTVGAWIGNDGQNLYAAELSLPGMRPVALTPAGGYVQNPQVVALRGAFGILFGWQPPGHAFGSDIYLALIAANNREMHHVRIIRIPHPRGFAIYPRAIEDGSGHIDLIYLVQYHPTLWHVVFQRLSNAGVAAGRAIILGKMSYAFPAFGGCGKTDPIPGQWAIDVKRAADGSVWAAWETGDDCVFPYNISGVNVLSVAHWGRHGTVLLRPTPVNQNVDANGQAVALALTAPRARTAYQGFLYYVEPGPIESHMVGMQFGYNGAASSPERVNYEGGGNVSNPSTAVVAGNPRIIWERTRLFHVSLVGTTYKDHIAPDVFTRLGLNVGNPWGNVALVVFGALGGGILLLLINLYLLVPLIAVWLLIRRTPPIVRWPLFLVAITLLLAWIFAARSTMPAWVLVITSPGFPYAWLAVAGAVLVSGWTGRYVLATQESGMRAMGMALISLYFVAVMYVVVYIEGQIGQI